MKQENKWLYYTYVIAAIFCIAVLLFSCSPYKRLQDRKPKNEKEKSKYEKAANTAIKAEENLEKWQLKQTYTQGAYKAAMGLMDRSLTPEAVTRMYKGKEIDLETATILKTVLVDGDFEIPDETVLTKPDYLLDLLEEAANNPLEAQKVMLDAIKAYGKNEMGFNQFGYFIDNANYIFEQQKLGNGSFMDKLVASVKRAKKFLKQIPGADGAGLTIDYLKSLSDSVDPAEAIAGSIRTYIKSRYAPGIYMDKNGNRVEIDENGDHKEAE